MNVNIFEVLFDFFDILISFSHNAFTLLFTEINILGYNFQLFYILGGGVLVALMIIWIVRRFI